MIRKPLHAGQSESSLYAPLPEPGGLPSTLQRIFDHTAGDAHLIKCVQSSGEAIIGDGPRQSTVRAAENERNYHIDCWHQGVLYGSGWTSDVREVARAAVAFHVEKLLIGEIAGRFPWLNFNEPAAFHERGAEFFVTKKWECLERSVRSKDFSYLNPLLPLVLEAASRPELRRLLPFISLTYLCFSRTTGYPYTHDCPCALAVNSTLFRVIASERETVLGEGDAPRAADLLVGNLPPNCGPAMNGTAEDLNC
jgi:hypothetical protein